MTRRVALAHDWFVNRGGAERVALSLAAAYPDAPMFAALAFPEQSFPEVAELDLHLSRLQTKASPGDAFRRLLLRYPGAFAALDATGYDVVLASTTAFAHHLHTDGCLIAYCHAPPRFLWDASYLSTSVSPLLRPLVRPLLARLRRQDAAAARRVHRYLANSRTTAARIARVYGIRAEVVPPPIHTDRFRLAPRTSDAWLAVGRLLPHRGFDLVVDAFTELRIPLVVIGDGPHRAALEARAGERVTFLGATDDATLQRWYGEARGVVVGGVEDFGLVGLEANASGRPVVARGAGGATETVVDGVTGLLFDAPRMSAIMDAVRRAEAMSWDPRVLRTHAERFDEAVFHQRIADVVAASETCVTCARRGAR